MTIQPFDYCEIALIDHMIKASKGTKVSEIKPISEQEAWSVYCEVEGLPKPGSKWFNDNRQRIYTVLGAVALCADEDVWEVLYRDEEWPIGQFRRRSVEEWYGKNRNGVQRFVEVK